MEPFSFVANAFVANAQYASTALAGLADASAVVTMRSDRLRDEFCAILGSIGRYKYGSPAYVSLHQRARLLKAELRRRGEPLQIQNTFDQGLPIHSAHNSHRLVERL